MMKLQWETALEYVVIWKTLTNFFFVVGGGGGGGSGIRMNIRKSCNWPRTIRWLKLNVEAKIQFWRKTFMVQPGGMEVSTCSFSWMEHAHANTNTHTHLPLEMNLNQSLYFEATRKEHYKNFLLRLSGLSTSPYRFLNSIRCTYLFSSRITLQIESVSVSHVPHSPFLTLILFLFYNSKKPAVPKKHSTCFPFVIFPGLTLSLCVFFLPS